MSVQKTVLWGFTFCLLGPAALADSLTTSPIREQVFKNTNCAQTNTCDLKSFTVQVNEYAVELTGYPGLNFGTKMLAGYETAKVEDLKNYGIVQFLRGCHYQSFKKDGKIVTYFGTTRPFYGKDVLFVHPKWVIDGLVQDPMDWGEKPKPQSRWDYYQWSPSGQGLSAKESKFVLRAAPTTPFLFVSDRPGSASFSEDSGIADNISLEFRTCLYRSADVPRTSKPEDIHFAKPISCLTWSSSYIYNFETRQFDNPQGLSDVCLKPEKLGP